MQLQYEHNTYQHSTALAAYSMVTLQLAPLALALHASKSLCLVQPSYQHQAQAASTIIIHAVVINASLPFHGFLNDELIEPNQGLISHLGHFSQERGHTHNVPATAATVLQLF